MVFDRLLRLMSILLLLGPAAARAATPQDRRSAATYAFHWNKHDFSGPGADHMRSAVSRAQFVLIGEEHNDRDTPLFARTLYEVLHRENGFRHLVVEQDPLGIDMALNPPQRGDAAAIGKTLKAWPTLLGFASDQDLMLLAEAGTLVGGPDAIWGLEQAQSPVRYLTELSALAPEGPVRTDVAALLLRARKEEPARADFAKFLGFDRQTLSDLKRLDAAWKPGQGSRAQVLLDALITSSEIYTYYVRAHEEHDPGLTYLNGTVREAWLKAQFVRDYRAAGGAPKAFFKFGDNHIRRGVGSTGAWTLGTFAADLATFDGAKAYAILVVPIGSDIPDWTHLPPHMAPLLPAGRPAEPVLIDLEQLRPGARDIISHAPADTREPLRELMFGFDAIVVLPDSAPATWRLTGFNPPSAG